MDKISVIIPAYKVEKYIGRCLESVINQSYKNLEIIIIDDGSPDNTGKIIDEYARLDNRIKVVHKENGGVSIARNIGLSMTTGKYIAFADSDDVLDEKLYEKLYNLIIKYEADVSFCELFRIIEGDEIIAPNCEVIEKEASIEEAIKMVLLNNDIGNYLSVKLFKKELFNEIKFPENRTYEDVSTIYKLLDKANKVAYTNEKLYCYLIGRDGAITSSFSEKKIKDSMIAYYSQYKFLVSKYPTIREYVSLIYAKMYTSALEKMCLNDYDELFESEEVNNRYNDFKDAIQKVDNKTLEEYLEDYRLVSMLVLKQSKDMYKKVFKSLYKMKK